MLETLELHGVQVTKELLQEPLEKGRALKGEIKEYQALKQELEYLQGVLEKTKALVIKLQKEVEEAIEINELKGEIKPIVKSSGDEKLKDKYDEFAGGSLEVFRIKVPDELTVYQCGLSVQEVKQRISQINSILAEKEQK